MVELLVAGGAALLAVLAAFQGAEAALVLSDRWRRRRSSKIKKLSSQKVSAECAMLEADFYEVVVVRDVDVQIEIRFTLGARGADVAINLVQLVSRNREPSEPDFANVSHLETRMRNEMAMKESDDTP